MPKINLPPLNSITGLSSSDPIPGPEFSLILESMRQTAQQQQTCALRMRRIMVRIAQSASPEQLKAYNQLYRDLWPSNTHLG